MYLWSKSISNVKGQWPLRPLLPLGGSSRPLPLYQTVVTAEAVDMVLATVVVTAVSPARESGIATEC